MDNFKMINDTEMGYLSGKMANNIEDNGRMGNSMEQGFIKTQKGKKKEVNGLMEKDKNGIDNI